jgi:hypothetical protein
MPGALGPLGREMAESDRFQMCLTDAMVTKIVAAKTTPASAEKMKRVSISGSALIGGRTHSCRV